MKMKICVADLEANGLLDTATQIWCGVFKDKATGEVVKFSPLDGEGWEKRMCSFLDTVDVLILHNGISYDRPLLKRYGGMSIKGR